jgi:tetratricopeptide (TPR) repeat protein
MPRLLRTVCLAALLVAAQCWRIWAADDASRSLDDRLLADTRDGMLQDFDLLSACLIAGGVTGERELMTDRSLLAAALERAQHIPQQDTAQQRAAAIHEQLHRLVLTGRYDKHATDLRRTLSAGHYNCLSATELFVERCRRAGVPVEIWSQPGHVYCVLGERAVRIEPASRPWRSAPLGVTTSAPARRITPVQLVGKFYYNRGIELLERHEFAAGIDALRLACRLDPLDADARTNLLAGLNNWALELAERDQPAAAAALIARGLAIDPDFAPLVANERYVAERARVRAPLP